jgi:hypothetical protein
VLSVKYFLLKIVLYLQVVNRFFLLFKYLHILMILRYIIWIFVIYALFRLVFDVILPIARVSGQMKKKMREFQDTMHQQNQPQESVKQHKDTKQKTGDYIDFEEVKS